MKNKFVLFVLLAAVFALPCYGQKKKSKEIEVPKEALKPYVSPNYFEEQLKEHIDEWMLKMAFPTSAKAYVKNFQNCQSISFGSVMQHLHSMRAIATHPDLEEVTRLPRSWYVEICNAALPLEQASKILLSVNSVPDEKTFQKAYMMYVQTIENVLAVYKNPPKKISKDRWEVICVENKKRRKQEWLIQYKKNQLEAAKKRNERVENGDKKKSDRKRQKNEKDSEE